MNNIKSKFVILLSGFLAVIAIIFQLSSCTGQSGMKFKNLTDEEVYAHLVEAIETGDRKTFDQLISRVSDINALIPYEDCEYSLLGLACKYKRLQMVEKIIRLDADLDTGKADEIFVNDALWIAVESEDLGLVKLLLSKGANPNRVQNEWGGNVLSLSCRLNHYDIAKLLIEAGAKADGTGDSGFGEYPDYPVISAVRNNNIALVQLLIDNNCTVSNDIWDGEGTVFEIAAEHSNSKMLDLLRRHATASKNEYFNIPDSMFPIPMRDGAIIPYDRYCPPEEGYAVTTYLYATNFMEIYKEQLRRAGFVDHGAVMSIDALWMYERSSDGATLVVEMCQGGDETGKVVFSIGMYVNFLSNNN